MKLYHLGPARRMVNLVVRAIVPLGIGGQSTYLLTTTGRNTRPAEDDARNSGRDRSWTLACVALRKLRPRPRPTSPNSWTAKSTSGWPGAPPPPWAARTSRPCRPPTRPPSFSTRPVQGAASRPGRLAAQPHLRSARPGRPHRPDRHRQHPRPVDPRTGPQARPAPSGRSDRGPAQNQHPGRSPGHLPVRLDRGLVVEGVIGAALVTAQYAQGLTRLSVPLPQLLIIAVLRASGTLAAWRPSRRTARLNILRAATTE